MRRRSFLARSDALCSAGIAGCFGDGDDHPSESIEYGPDAFVTKWETVSVGELAHPGVVLPLLDDGSYDFEVQWGDGSSEHVEGNYGRGFAYTYAEEGTYEIAIEGTLEGWSFRDLNENLLEISQWGMFDVGVGDADAVSRRQIPDVRNNFSDTYNLDVTAADIPQIEGESLAYVFANTGITDPPTINHWDVESVESMRRMFAYVDSFEANLSDWDVSNVVDMNGMFEEAS